MLARNSNNRLVVVKTAYAERLSGQGKKISDGGHHLGVVILER
ncbi:MAG: hypothetical protein AB1545_15905 [Thermodesulfobacteriota bacterium]|jgi:hypothetical protein